MNFDLPTLLAVGAFIAVVSALALLIAIPRGPDSRGALWWVFGGFVTALALTLRLLGAAGDNAALARAAVFAFAIAPALYWTAARVVAGRRPAYPLIVAGVALYALVTLAPPFAVPTTVRTVIALAIMALYFLAGAIELARSRVQASARWPLFALFLIYAVLFAVGAAESTLTELPEAGLVPLSSWYGLVHFELIVFSVGTAALVIALIRERRETRQRRLAETDEVTGVATRRALLEQAEEALHRCQAADAPLSLVIFDLDHFKLVNDRFGHSIGDAVLRHFGDTVRTVLRENDRVGRLGGEEFALLLPGTSLAEASAIADRVRVAFEAGGKILEGIEIGSTVSAGVATVHRESTVQSMLIAADEGLYEAKARGRNRVERPPAKMGRDGQNSLNLVA